MSALGADFSVISTNPASLAAFRKSDLVITPGFHDVNTNSRLLGGNSQNFQENFSRITLNNAGVVVASNPPKGNWTTVNFSFGLQRVADFGQDFFFQGRGPGSIIDRFTALADGKQPNQLDDFEAGLAYDVGAIFGPDAAGFYFNDLQGIPDYTLTRSQAGVYGGRANELSLALSGNLDEKLMIGMSIGIPFYSVNWDKTYEEIDLDNSIPVFNSISFREQLDASGSGVNFKFGAVVKPAKGLRVGLAVHSPTFMTITENYRNSMTYEFSDLSGPRSISRTSPDGQFTYRLVTPWRTLISAGYIIEGFGFVSAEAEYVDFGSSEFRFRNATPADRAFQRELNADIKNNLGGTLMLRSGMEYARDRWRLRAGLLLDGNPYKGETGFTPGYSLGVGLREELFFIDLAFIRRSREVLYRPYKVENVPSPEVYQRIRNSLVSLTIGFKI